MDKSNIDNNISALSFERHYTNKTPDPELERIGQQHLDRECRTGAELAKDFGANLTLLQLEMALPSEAAFVAHCQRQFGLPAPLLHALIKFASSQIQ